MFESMSIPRIKSRAQLRLPERTIFCWATIVEEVAEEYGANATVALTRAKAYVSEAAEEGRGVAPHELAAEVFEDEPLQERFVEAAAEENIPERVRVDKKAAERITRKARSCSSELQEGGQGSYSLPFRSCSS